ncbi:MAG: GvpL/GvpF family gas vesicle protein [Methanomicrobium sp.]|nr:GvpL/GvpF family gas vesicle protein [Methanomicrobium sp.]
MGMPGKYIYGIINSGEEILRTDDEYGIYTIPFQDISAVVSDSEIIDYRHLPGGIIAQHLVRHQVVIEKVMKNFNVIPMRLGTFLLNMYEVEQVLRKGKDIIKEIFNQIRNRIEMDVTATWSDINMIIKEVAEEEEIKTLRQELLNKKEGVTTDEQIKIGFLIKSCLNERKMKYAGIILDAIKIVSESHKSYECTDDTMIVNVACLINKDVQSGFEEKLEKLSGNFENKVKFRSIGPLPAYSFYTLEIKKIKPSDIDWAAKKLGLTSFATWDDIKKAYKSCAFMCHPDKQADTKMAEIEYNEITRAYKLLSEYCKHDTCSFSEEDVAANTVSIRVRE